MSAFLGPDQAATEALLATDPQAKPWVEKYQRSRETVSQTDYEVSPIIYDFLFTHFPSGSKILGFNWGLLIFIKKQNKTF